MWALKSQRKDWEGRNDQVYQMLTKYVMCRWLLFFAKFYLMVTLVYSCLLLSISRLKVSQAQGSYMKHVVEAQCLQNLYSSSSPHPSSLYKLVFKYALYIAARLSDLSCLESFRGFPYLHCKTLASFLTNPSVSSFSASCPTTSYSYTYTLMWINLQFSVQRLYRLYDFILPWLYSSCFFSLR